MGKGLATVLGLSVLHQRRHRPASTAIDATLEYGKSAADAFAPAGCRFWNAVDSHWQRDRVEVAVAQFPAVYGLLGNFRGSLERFRDPQARNLWTWCSTAIGVCAAA